MGWMDFLGESLDLEGTLRWMCVVGGESEGETV